MYIHKVKYYETDRMGITHHSNYIRWMEDARLAFLEDLGWGLDRLEKEGVMSPVLTVESTYKHTTTFPELISIKVRVSSYNGTRLGLSYVMTNKDGVIVNVGSSSHCFINENGAPVRVDKRFPEFHNALKAQLKPND